MFQSFLKSSLIFFLLICFSLGSFGQSNENQETLLEFPRSKYESIVNGRRIIYKRFMEKDSLAVSEILNYFVREVEDDKNIAMLPEEYWLYYYWLGQYAKVLNSTNKYDSAYIKEIEKKKFPPRDGMMNKLIDQLRIERHLIYNQITESSKIKEEDKDFLKLNFDQLLSWGLGKDSCVDSLNVRRDLFLRKFPESNQSKYVKDFIGIEFKTKSWSFSAEFFTGFGLYTEEIGKLLTPIVPLGISFDFRYHHFALRFIDYIGFSKTRDTIYNSKVTWRKNAPARIFIPGLTFGYYIIDKKKIKLFPFVGISSSSIGPPLFASDKEGNKDAGLDFSTTLTYGLSLDVFLQPEKETDFNWISRDLHYFRVTYVYYQPQFEKKYIGFNGNMHSITIGYVMFQNPRRRIK